MADLTAQETRTSINARVLLLSQEFNTFKSDINTKVDNVTNSVGQLSRDLQTWMHTRQPKLNVWIPTIGTVLVGFWFVLNLQLTSATKSLSDTVSRQEVLITTNSTGIARVQEQIPTIIQQNADSNRDRTDLNRKYDYLAERVSRNEALQSRLDASLSKSLIEVETQLRAGENYDNLQRKYNNTEIALLWQKAFGTDYPRFEFYPSISQHGGSSKDIQ